MKLNLPDTVSSPQDLAGLIVDVQSYARWFSHESIKKQAHAKAQSEPPAISHEATDMIRRWGESQPLNRTSLEELMSALNDYRLKAPTLVITLAAPPTRSVKSTLVAWCRENIASHVLITFEFNSTLLGGMAVRSGSHVFDWSFRRQILDARHAFPEKLHSV